MCIIQDLKPSVHVRGLALVAYISVETFGLILDDCIDVCMTGRVSPIAPSLCDLRPGWGLKLVRRFFHETNTIHVYNCLDFEPQQPLLKLGRLQYFTQVYESVHKESQVRNHRVKLLLVADCPSSFLKHRDSLLPLDYSRSENGLDLREVVASLFLG